MYECDKAEEKTIMFKKLIQYYGLLDKSDSDLSDEEVKKGIACLVEEEC